MAVKSQTKTSEVGSGSSTTISFDSLPTVGCRVIVRFGGYTAAACNPTCSDNQGHTYTRRQFVQVNTTATWVALFDCTVATSSGTFTITLSTGGGAGAFNIAINDTLMAVNYVDSSGTTGTSTSPTPGSITSTTSNSFSVGGVEIDSGATITLTTPSGWTSDFKQTSGSAFTIGDLISREDSSPTVLNPSWTITSNPWAAAIATYSDATLYTLEQEGFQWRNDDGSETTATPLAAQDTNATVAAATNARLRMLIDNGSGDPPSLQFQLEYRKVGGDNIWRKIEP